MIENDIFQSEYFKVNAFNDDDRTYTILKVEFQKFSDDPRKKLDVIFDAEEKKFVCNRTIFRAIKKITGEENTDNWSGEKITLGTEDILIRGDYVPGLRVRYTKVNVPIRLLSGCVRYYIERSRSLKQIEV